MIFELILCAILAYLIYLFSFEESHKNSPPGPKRIKYIGNLHQLVKYANLRPYESLEKISKSYGPIVSVKLGVQEQVVINDFELIKEVLCSDIWTNRFFDDWLAKRSFGKELGLIMAGGEGWKEMRRFTLKTLKDFGFGKKQSMELSIEEELTDLLSRINAKIDTGSSVFEMREFFNISVLNLLWCLMSGQRFSHKDEKIIKLVQLISQMSKNFPVAGNLYIMFPILRHFEFITSKGKLRKNFYSNMHQYFREVLDFRRQEGHYKEDQRDFLDVFLKEIDEKKEGGEIPNHFTDEQFIMVAFDLFSAGADTTSNTLEFSILYMIMNPHVQKKVQQEIDLVVGRERLPSILDKPNMPYTEATLLEVQRMANILPLIIRGSTADSTLAGYNILKGTTATLNIHSMHMNEKIWGENTKTFRPERFLEKINDGFKIINAHKILPFGLGKRVCIGEVLARASLFTYFATFLQRFNFSLPPGHSPLTDEPQVGFTLSPQNYSALFTHRK